MTILAFIVHNGADEARQQQIKKEISRGVLEKPEMKETTEAERWQAKKRASANW